jgi:hypothetical protein
MVTVVFLSFRVVRLSHAVAPNTGAVVIAAIVNRNLVGLVMADGSILAYYHALFGGKTRPAASDANGSSIHKVRTSTSARIEERGDSP